ncbi:hypothetical protein SDC9_155278 [bioreactor metagenome]|uniref:Uncharacterized protein n=1 Tax=bioreactor metagenome TaxID=1076179 RepID=A0A645F3A4_9ZZZZ
MKKNWMLRLGLLAMVLTLVTMPMVSSTYAKYVSEASGTDTARVARWGVTLTSNLAPMFGDAYTEGASTIDTWSNTLGDASELSVVAIAQGTNVLAPGTGGSFSFVLTGTPEVALDLNVVASVTRTGWTVNSVNDYEPIKFVFSNGNLYWNGTGWQASSVQISASQLQFGLLSLDNPEVDTNTNLATMNGGTGTYTVTWEWPFFVDALVNATGNPGSDGFSDYTNLVKDATPDPDLMYTYDEADTILGSSVSSGAAPLTGPTLAINLVITATQIN